MAKRRSKCWRDGARCHRGNVGPKEGMNVSKAGTAAKLAGSALAILIAAGVVASWVRGRRIP